MQSEVSEINMILSCALCGALDDNDDFVDMNHSSIVLADEDEMVVEFREIIQELLNLKVCLHFFACLQSY
jgi:hypothetical protein